MEIRIRTTGEMVSEYGFRYWVHVEGLKQDPPLTILLPEVLTPEIVREFGADPVLNAPIPQLEYNQLAVRNGATQDSNGEWIQSYQIIPRFSSSIEEQVFLTQELKNKKDNLHNRVADKRREVQSKGLKYTFPDSTLGTIQVRNEQDLININGQVSAALILSSQGVDQPVLSFRDEENVSHTMTPAQVIAMGMASSQFINSCYSAKWALDEQIEAWDGIAVIDIEEGWPE